jgi:hypothetical protein
MFDSSNSEMTRSNGLGSSHSDFHSSQSKNSTHMFTYLTPLKKPRLDSNQTATTNSQKQYLMGCEYQKNGKVNFSNFSIPAVFLKSTHQQRVQEKESKEVASTKFQQQKHLTLNAATKSNSAYERSRELLPTVDEHSEAASSHTNAPRIRGKRKASAINLCNAREPSSVCSLEASNDLNFGVRKSYEDTDDSPYLSDDVSGIQETICYFTFVVSYYEARTLDTTRTRHRHSFNMKCYVILVTIILTKLD